MNKRLTDDELEAIRLDDQKCDGGRTAHHHRCISDRRRLLAEVDRLRVMFGIDESWLATIRRHSESGVIASLQDVRKILDEIDASHAVIHDLLMEGAAGEAYEQAVTEERARILDRLSKNLAEWDLDQANEAVYESPTVTLLPPGEARREAAKLRGENDRLRGVLRKIVENGKKPGAIIMGYPSINYDSSALMALKGLGEGL